MSLPSTERIKRWARRRGLRLQLRRVGNGPTEFRVLSRPIEDGEYASGAGWRTREQMVRIVDIDEEAEPDAD